MAGWSPADKLPRTLVGPRRNRSVSMERFSLLLLEFGEIYFEDFSAICYPNASTESESIDRKQRGRLKVCSKSMIFDPLDHAHPMLKIALRDCKEIVTFNSVSNTGFKVTCSQYTEMLEGNIIAPYKFIRNEMRCRFSLSYVNVESVLPQIKTLQQASTLPKADQQRVLNRIVQERHSKVSFNVSWLEDLYEETVVETSGERVTPLVSNPGRIMLTSSRIYFQPYNNVQVEPVLKFKLSDLKYATKRRYMLRHVGLELLCGSGKCMFLVLPSAQERNWLYDRLLAQPRVSLSQDSLVEATLKWQHGDMTNYQYLMLLNFLSDRSFNDIMQYPVMPWVVADYTSDTLDLTNPATFRDLSKPIGALNVERLSFFKERYEEMRGNKFLYGTHYSAPGYVLYFLVREAPEYLLCLQNGKFDQPNRLFHRIARTWKNVNTDHADVKELIPEFYQPPGDFLLNLQSLDLGVRTDGMRVNDVILPPWANTAEEFTQQLQAALECDYVSSHLHHWIDLIFGYKQQGEEAIKANNLFHYLTYEGAFNLDYIRDPEELAAIELQIKEFGQTPKQLFLIPHPRKVDRSKIQPLELELNSVAASVQSSGVTTQGLASTLTPSPNSHASHSDTDLSVSGTHTASTLTPVISPTTLSSPAIPPTTPISPVIPPDTPTPSSSSSRDCYDDWVHIDVAPDDTPSTGTCTGSKGLRLRHMEKVHKETVSAVNVSHDSKSYFSVSNDKTIKVHTMEDNQLVRSSTVSNLPLSSLAVLPGSTAVLIGSWDNNVYTYSTEYAAVVSSEYCHHSSVTCLCWRHGTMATGSWDSTVKIWTLPFDPSHHKPDPAELQCELDHDNEVTCVDLDCDALRVASGTVDGYVTVWSIADQERDFELQAHNDGVYAVVFSPDGSKLCMCGGDSIVRVVDPASKLELISKRAPEVLHCVVWLGEYLVLGGESGDLHVWEADTLTEVARHKAHSSMVTCLHLSRDSSVLVSGSKDKCVGVWQVASHTPTAQESS